MELQIRHQPAFSTARATLQPNEQMRLESGAMVAMSPDMVVEGKMEGGFLKALKRSALGGESFFQTTATAGPNGGFVDVAMAFLVTQSFCSPPLQRLGSCRRHLGSHLQWVSRSIRSGVA